MSTGQTAEQLTASLASCRAAYQRLVSGATVVKATDSNGEQIEYSAASRMALYNYIVTLEAELAALQGTPWTGNRPLRFVF